MKKITIPLNDGKLEISIDKYKIFYGSNYICKYNIIKTLKSFFLSSTSDSNSFTNNNILLNDSLINRKDWLLYEVNQNFNLEDDVKLGSKSLILKYLESKMVDFEYDDSFITIKTILENIETDYFENINYFDEEFSIKFSFDEITTKKILKLLSGKILINGSEDSMYNLSYYQIIKLQLMMLNEISNTSEKEIIIVLDGHVDDKILDTIDMTNFKNCLLLIFTGSRHKVRCIDDYCLVNKLNIDLFDDLSIHEHILGKLPYYVENKEQLIPIIADYVNKNYSQNSIELEKMI